MSSFYLPLTRYLFFVQSCDILVLYFLFFFWYIWYLYSFDILIYSSHDPYHKHMFYGDDLLRVVPSLGGVAMVLMLCGQRKNFTRQTDSQRCLTVSATQPAHKSKNMTNAAFFFLNIFYFIYFFLFYFLFFFILYIYI